LGCSAENVDLPGVVVSRSSEDEFMSRADLNALVSQIVQDGIDLSRAGQCSGVDQRRAGQLRRRARHHDASDVG